MANVNFTITDNSGAFKEVKREAIIRAMEAVGEHLEGEAADELWNDPQRYDTGRLHSSITHSSDETGTAVGTNVEYGIYVIRKPTKEQAA